MEDLFSLVILGIFFLLPLLRRLGGQVKTHEQHAPAEGEPAGVESWRVPAGSAEAEPTGIATQSVATQGSPESIAGEGGWSEGWMPWPSSPPAELPPPDTSMHPEIRSPRVRPAEEMVLRTVSLPRPAEPLPSESGERSTRSTHAVVDLTPASRSSEAATSRSGRRERTSKSDRHAPSWQLESAADLRRAIILKEVLGPPVSLR